MYYKRQGGFQFRKKRRMRKGMKGEIGKGKQITGSMKWEWNIQSCTRSLPYMKQCTRHLTCISQNIIAHKNVSSVFKSKIFPSVHHRTICLVKKNVEWMRKMGTARKERKGRWKACLIFLNWKDQQICLQCGFS